jgi:hypothetical protein
MTKWAQYDLATGDIRACDAVMVQDAALLAERGLGQKEIADDVDIGRNRVDLETLELVELPPSEE